MTIVEETLCFDFPVVRLNENISTFELFHGPTMAFKDVGVCFMNALDTLANNTNEVTVLVATQGYKKAVASGFVKGVNVVILYPSGKVSEIQETINNLRAKYNSLRG